MELAMEFEDDLFFADISKQISLLIMDDDEDPVANYPSSAAFQNFSRGNLPTASSQFTYLQTCRRESKGTGVFIPRSSQPRRKHRQGKQNNNNSFNSKTANKHHDSTRIASHHHQVSSYNNSLYPKKG